MKIRSDELTIATATKNDIPELDELYVEACGFFKFDRQPPLREPAECLRGGDLPQGGRPENYDLLTIRINGMLIGYASVYRDFPGKEYVDLSLLYIGEPARGCGFGTRAAELICNYFYEAGYECIRITVSLRSWGGLRFWNRLGFDRVTGLDAAGDCADGGYGSVSLEKKLAQRW